MNNNDIVSGFDNQACDYLEIGLTRGRGATMDLLISLKGSIDAYNSDCLRQRIRMVIDAGFTRLSFVLSGVDSISSTGVATFLSLQKELEEKGGGITMVNVPGKIKGVFALLCLQTFFRCIESLDPENG
ncbi:MAG TPA: STAS domain-containing protein [Spirochaetia bacterium]|nr:STAS domain-containing protein [Spirochaetia bacterium]